MQLNTKQSIQNHLDRAGALHSTPRVGKASLTPAGAMRAIKSGPHSEFMLATYGVNVPKEYIAWTGSEVDLAWCGGFVDGEAWVGAHWQRYSRDTGRNPCPVLKLSIYQNHFETLQHFQQILQVHSRLCAVPQAASQNRQGYSLTYEGKHALEAMKRLRPYVIRKGREIDVCVQLWYEGKMGKPPGYGGHPMSVWQSRTKLMAKIAALK